MAEEGKFELGRYGSAAGYEPKDVWKKHRDKVATEQAKELEPEDSMLDLKPASKWISSAAKPPAELYGPLWREGEVAVLLGEPGAGKSLLAVQIAEDIARGKSAKGRVTRVNQLNSAYRSQEGGLAPALPSSPPYEGGVATLRGRGGSLSRPQAVLYIDFQRTTAQWTERYTTPSPIPGKLPLKCKFKFERAAIDWNLIDPVKFNRNPLQFALHSIRYKIEKSNAKIVIIDDITLGGVTLLRPTNATARIMQTLKFWSATEGLSILVLAGVSGPRVSSPHVSKGSSRTRRVPSIPQHFTVADSIFTLNHSTFGPQYRYVKSLKHSAISDQHPAEVSAYELISSTPLLPDSSTPHLPIFLKDLGPSSESDHLRDYQKEAERVSSPHVSKGLTAESDRAKRLRRLSRESAVEMLMSKEYWRYLGE